MSLPIAMHIPTLPTTSIPTPMRELLSTYSSISLESQAAHILTLRDKAYAMHKYPCLGRFRFLELDGSCHPVYPVLLGLFRDWLGTTKDGGGDVSGTSGSISRSQGNNRTGDEGKEAAKSAAPVYLDLGCCLGQDIRKLLFDLTPSQSLPPSQKLVQQIFGADLLPEFIDTGYKLFRDEDVIPRSQLVAPADIFDKTPDNALARLDGKVNVLHTGAFFHLFDLERQKIVARRCLRLLRKEGVGFEVKEGEIKNQTGVDEDAYADANTGTRGAAEGGAGMASTRTQAEETEGQEVTKSQTPITWSKNALMFGEQVGNISPSHTASNSGGMRYRHDPETWKNLWQDIIQEDEWKNVVKSVTVESIMEGRSMASKHMDRLGGGEDGGNGEGKEAAKKKFFGAVEEGFRWHVWWVWAEFE